MAVLVRHDIALRERSGICAETVAQDLEELEVQVDEPVARAVRDRSRNWLARRRSRSEPENSNGLAGSVLARRTLPSRYAWTLLTNRGSGSRRASFASSPVRHSWPGRNSPGPSRRRLEQGPGPAGFRRAGRLRAAGRAEAAAADGDAAAAAHPATIRDLAGVSRAPGSKDRRTSRTGTCGPTSYGVGPGYRHHRRQPSAHRDACRMMSRSIAGTATHL